MSEPDLLSGWRAIAGHLGLSPDAARHLSKTSGLPTFRLGKTACGRRSTLDTWLAQREAAGRGAPEQEPRP